MCNVHVCWGAAGTSLAGTYSSPYKVLRRGKKVALLRLSNRKEWVLADQLKLHLGEDPSPADPPKRGRPTVVSWQLCRPKQSSDLAEGYVAALK